MKKLISVVALVLCANLAHAEIAVVVHPSNGNALDNNTISRIFTGKMKSFPDGSSATPLNQGASSAATSDFNSKVLNKSASQLKAYWSKLLFTGKGTPPKEVGSDADVISTVSSSPDAIGYVNASAVTDAVKVVATF